MDQQTSDTGRLEGLKAGAMSPAVAAGLVLAAFVPGIGVATQAAYIHPQAGVLTWLSLAAGALFVLCVAVAVIVFARRFVVSGALYSYVSRVFGRNASVVTAASILFAYALGILFLVVVGAIYLGTFLAALGIEWGPTPLAFTVFAIGIVVIGCIVTHFGVDVSARLSIVLLVLTLPVVLIVTALIPVSTPIDLAPQFDIAGSGVPFTGFVGGVTLALAVMILFESSTATAVETRSPKRSLPWLVAGLPILLGVLYSLSALIQIPALPAVEAEIAAGTSAISAFAGLSGLAWLGPWIDLSLAVAAISAVIAFLNYGSRIAATMAQDGVLPGALARVSARRGTPQRANILVGAIVIVFAIVTLAITGGDPYSVYSFTAALYALFVVIPYVLVCVGAVLLLRRERARSWPWVLVTSTIGSAAFLWLLVSGFVTPATGVMAWVPYIFVGTLAVSVAGLAVFERRRRRAVAGAV